MEITTEKRVECAHCGTPSEIARREPGVVHYKPCAVCGQIGIRIFYAGVQYQDQPTTRRKKGFRQLYERR
jgi:hypothetical protein